MIDAPKADRTGRTRSSVSALPLSFGLIAVRYLIRLYRFIFHFDPDTMLNEPDDDGVDDRIRKSQT